MKRWMTNCGKDVELELNKHDQQEAGAWFTALDMDGSNSVEEEEVRALMEALGVEATTKHLSEMFASIGKGLDAELTKREFVKLMTLHGASLTGQKAHAGNDLFDANTRLMMLSYRRKALLDDIQDPIKRRNFVDEQAFVKHYGPPLYGALTVKRPDPPPLTPAPPVQPPPPSGAVGSSHHRSYPLRRTPRTLSPPSLPSPPSREPAAPVVATSAEVARAAGDAAADESAAEEQEEEAEERADQATLDGISVAASEACAGLAAEDEDNAAPAKVAAVLVPELG